jgi:hypothetical protein
LLLKTFSDIGPRYPILLKVALSLWRIDTLGQAHSIDDLLLSYLLPFIEVIPAYHLVEPLIPHRHDSVIFILVVDKSLELLVKPEPLLILISYIVYLPPHLLDSLLVFVVAPEGIMS